MHVLVVVGGGRGACGVCGGDKEMRLLGSSVCVCVCEGCVCVCV